MKKLSKTICCWKSSLMLMMTELESSREAEAISGSQFQFQTNLYINQGERHQRLLLQEKKKLPSVRVTTQGRGSTLHLIGRDVKTEELREKWDDQNTFSALSRSSADSRLLTPVPELKFQGHIFSQSEHEAEALWVVCVSHGTSHLNRAVTYPTITWAAVRSRWTWKAVFMLQQTQLSFHVPALSSHFRAQPLGSAGLSKSHVTSSEDGLNKVTLSDKIVSWSCGVMEVKAEVLSSAWI